MRLLLALVLVLAAGCAVDGARPPRDGVEIDPPPERDAAALRFAALAPLPAGARVPRLQVQGGIDTRVALTVVLDPAAVGPWLAAGGAGPAGPDGELAQQRVANPDGAVVYRDGRVAGGRVEVAAFTT